MWHRNPELIFLIKLGVLYLRPNHSTTHARIGSYLKSRHFSWGENFWFGFEFPVVRCGNWLKKCLPFASGIILAYLIEVRMRFIYFISFEFPILCYHLKNFCAKFTKKRNLRNLVLLSGIKLDFFFYIKLI